MDMTIKLPSGHISTIDAEDFDKIKEYLWFASKRGNIVYAQGRLHGEQSAGIYLHRLVLNAVKGEQIDHIDGNGLNNRKSNLRFCTQAQNTINAGKKRQHKNYKGVYYRPDRGTWYAQIYVARKSYYVGTFETEAEAALAYNEKAKELHGEFARLNKI